MRPWFVLFPVLSGTALTALLLTLFWPALLPVLAGAIALNIAVRYATDRRIDALVGAFRQLAPVVAAGESLRFLEGPDVEPLIGPLGSDVAQLRRLKTIARWVSGDPLMLSFSGSALQHVITDTANALYAHVDLFFLIEATGVFAGARDLRAHGRSLVRVVSAIGEVDAALSVASYRAGRGDWTRPRFLAAGAPAVLADIRHPLVAGAVPNTTTIEPGHGLLVTGSNSRRRPYQETATAISLRPSPSPSPMASSRPQRSVPIHPLCHSTTNVPGVPVTSPTYTYPPSSDWPVPATNSLRPSPSVSATASAAAHCGNGREVDRVYPMSDPLKISTRLGAMAALSNSWIPSLSTSATIA